MKLVAALGTCRQFGLIWNFIGINLPAETALGALYLHKRPVWNLRFSISISQKLTTPATQRFQVHGSQFTVKKKNSFSNDPECIFRISSSSNREP
jgi:hypothetical protein